MNWWQPIVSIINMLIFVSIFWFLFDAKRKQKYPDNPMSRLETAVRIATKAATKRYPDNPAVRDLTVSHVIELYHEWELPVPSRTAIELAIDAATSDT